MADLLGLLRDRYGAAAPQIDDSFLSHTLDTLLAHRSVRAYRSAPLPEGTLDLLIAAAQSAASSSNLQTWSVVAVEDGDRKARLSELAGGQAHIQQCPLFLVWLADLARLEAIATQIGQPAAALDYLELFVTAVVDASLAAQNAVIAAESMGLGTVYIGAMRNDPDRVAAELHLPSRVFAIFGLCVGYPDPNKPADVKPRLPQPAVLHRETYSLEAQRQPIERYNDVMATFYAAQQMAVERDWAHHSVERIATTQAMRGRDRLRSILQTMGFLLQ